MRPLGFALLLALTGCVSNAPPPIPLKPVRFLLLNDVYTADTLADGQGGLARGRRHPLVTDNPSAPRPRGGAT